MATVQVGGTARRAHVAEVRGMGAGSAIVVLEDPMGPSAAGSRWSDNPPRA
jgi:hypothetical protein